MKIVFFGTSEFSAIILEKMVQEGFAPVLVVTAPDKPAGRKKILTPPPLKLVAQKYGISTFQPATLDQPAILNLKSQNPELIVLSAYGRIIPKEVLDIPRYGALNVHPSLLPKLRGASPIQSVILQGEKETGVTIILMDEKIDHGPIIARSKLEIENLKPSYPELHKKLAEMGADLLIQTIPKWVEGKIKPIPQDDLKATYTKIFKKEDGRIDWKNSAEYIERQVRALNPWPGTYTYWDGRMLKILKADVVRSNRETDYGKIFQTADGRLAVQTGENALLVEELQLEGGKPMPSKEFLLGHKNILGTKLV